MSESFPSAATKLVIFHVDIYAIADYYKLASLKRFALGGFDYVQLEIEAGKVAEVVRTICTIAPTLPNPTTAYARKPLGEQLLLLLLRHRPLM